MIILFGNKWMNFVVKGLKNDNIATFTESVSNVHPSFWQKYTDFYWVGRTGGRTLNHETCLKYACSHCKSLDPDCQIVRPAMTSLDWMRILEIWVSLIWTFPSIDEKRGGNAVQSPSAVRNILLVGLLHHKCFILQNLIQPKCSSAL